MRSLNIAVLLSGLVLFVAVPAPSAHRARMAAAETVWKLITATCVSGEQQTGVACFNANGHGAEWASVGDSSASSAASDIGPSGGQYNFGYVLPQTIGPGQPNQLTLTAAVSQTTGGGAHARLCATLPWSTKEAVAPCATTKEESNGGSDSASTTLTLIPESAPSAPTVDVKLVFETPGGQLRFTYKATSPAPPPTFERVPAPSGFDQRVTAPEPAPGGAALLTSPSIAAAGAVVAPSAVSVDVSGLSVRDQVIANARHDCYVQFVKAIRGIAAQRLISRVNGDYRFFEKHLGLRLAALAECLAFVDAYAKVLNAPAADVAAASCNETPVVLSLTGSGSQARLKSFRVGDKQQPLKISCARSSGGLAILVSTGSKRTPLSSIVGSRLQLLVVRSKSDTTGGQLSVAFHKS